MWGDDITEYAWLRQGTGLLVASSPTYGTGGVYQVDLRARRSVVLLRAGAGDDRVEFRILAPVYEDSLALILRVSGRLSDTVRVRVSLPAR
jgi:hypothetical protein